VKLFGSVVDGTGATVNTSGGTGGNAGGNGRLIFGSNTGIYNGTATGASIGNFVGTREANPFILGNPMTPDVPDLLGGAEAYGLTGLNANDLTGLLGAIPFNAVAALLRLDIGPAGFADDFTGFDMLLILNLLGSPLANPMLGIDPAGQNSLFTVGLLQGGFMHDPLFGGGGPVGLGSLGALDVYATLIPDSGTRFNGAFDSFGQHITGSVDGLQDGGAFFFIRPIPEPSTILLFGSGLAAMGVAAWRRNRRQ
jgi:hypothetical protein